MISSLSTWHRNFSSFYYLVCNNRHTKATELSEVMSLREAAPFEVIIHVWSYSCCLSMKPGIKNEMLCWISSQISGHPCEYPLVLILYGWAFAYRSIMVVHIPNRERSLQRPPTLWRYFQAILAPSSLHIYHVVLPRSKRFLIPAWRSKRWYSIPRRRTTPKINQNRSLILDHDIIWVDVIVCQS